MHYFDNFRLLKQCYFDEKYSELYRVTAREVVYRALTGCSRG